MKSAIPALACLFLLTGAAQEGTKEERLIFQTEKAQNTFIELYTSDANAACNNALSWMSRLKTSGDSAGLWKRIVPVAMHVDYWDELGHKDTFAQKPFNEFLLRYKRKWAASKVYAPTLVVNGTEWNGWSRGQDIPAGLPRDVGMLKVDGSKREFHYLVAFVPEKAVDTGDLVVHGVLLAFNAKSKPFEGENRGRLLNHDFVAIAYRKQPLKLSYGIQVADIELPSKKGAKPGQYAVAFWVTRQYDNQAIQATGGYLPEL